MNGKRVLLDTNAIIAFLQNNQQVIRYTDSAEWWGISIISQIEFLSFPGLSARDQATFAKFIGRAEIIDLDSGEQNFINRIAQIRRDFRIKLPDAIIAATALHYFDGSIITADKGLIAIPGLNILPF